MTAEPDNDPAPPLDGILVADFSRVLAGPLCTMLLADAGARVIKVERPGDGDETRRWGPPFVGSESAYFLAVNRGKSSLTLDLGQAEGRAISRRLIGRADVVVENFLPQQRTRFALDPETVRLTNRRAVLCSISGFPLDSDRGALPAFDLLAQATGGLMAITGPETGEPSKVGVAISDVLTAHYAHGAILAALVARSRDGAGRSVSVSLHGATVASLVNVAQSFLVSGEEPRRWGNAHPTIVPYQSFRARDRNFVLAAANDSQFEALCTQVLHAPELCGDPRFSTNASRVGHREALVPHLAARFAENDADHWVSRCRAAGVPAATVAGLGEIFADETSTVTVDHPSCGPLRLPRDPVRRDHELSPALLPPPRLGEHTDALLRELGLTPSEITHLRSRHII